MALIYNATNFRRIIPGQEIRTDSVTAATSGAGGVLYGSYAAGTKIVSVVAVTGGNQSKIQALAYTNEGVSTGSVDLYTQLAASAAGLYPTVPAAGLNANIAGGLYDFVLTQSGTGADVNKTFIVTSVRNPRL